MAERVNRGAGRGRGQSAGNGEMLGTVAAFRAMARGQWESGGAARGSRPSVRAHNTFWGLENVFF